MAIVKMKRLRLMLVRSQKEELLRELTRLGCVQVTALEEELQEQESQGLVHRESSELTALKTRHAALERSLELLRRYAPEKKPLLSAKPELESEALLETDGLEEALALAAQLDAREDRIRRIGAEESRQRSLIESLMPWVSLDLPLETEGTERCAVVLGSLSLRIPLDQVEKKLAETAEEAELFPVSLDGSQQYLLLLVSKDQLAAAQECLRGFGFSAASLSGCTGTARDGVSAAETSLLALGKEKAALVKEIAAEGPRREKLQLAADRLATRIAMAETEEKLYGTGSAVVLEGWIPAEKEEELSKLLERFTCAWETSEPTEDEYPQVPVKLKNNKFSNALNMVTDMYSLPAYGSVDANPVMAPFFILFYGLMMADMGYGIIMIAAALVAMKKIRPRGGTLAFCQLLLYAGVSTFVMGALTGSLFGNAPEVIAGMFGSQWKGLPALFSPVKDSTLVLYGAMALGVIHLNVGMIVSFLEKKRAGNLMDGVFEEGPLWVILLGGVLLALDMLGLVKSQALHYAGLAILILGGVMLLYGAGRHAKGFGKVTAAFGVIYSTLTGWFGDILSYSRIMALMLAGGVVAQVFNTIAAMPSENGVTVFSGIIFLLIFLVGHALNFGLNLLGCFVHDLRLQCLEFFGKFYQDGGKRFEPLEIHSKYAVPKEE
ncbi:MAG: V-type ATP synthase subunit I [Oscillospiraceae bacterium]|nr:V-type ATP synthase subunit I [Oscillospiraceae bacterium]